MNDRSADGEPQSRRGAFALLRLPEPVESPSDTLFCHADSIVRYGKDQSPGLLLHPYLDASASRSEPQCIANQVGQYLLQPRAIYFDLLRMRVDVMNQVDVFLR